MAYPQDVLNDDEELIFHRHPHWAYLLGPGVMVILCVVVAIVLTIVDPVLGLVGLLLVVIAAVGSLGQFLRWRTTEYTLTTERLMTRRGILSKAGVDIPVDRIMNVSYSQKLWERLMGVGDIVIESAGEQGQQYFTDVAKPIAVQNEIYRQVEKATDYGLQRRGRGMPGSPGKSAGEGPASTDGGGLSMPEQLEKLDQLRQRGVLNDDEFKAQKQKLLDGQ